MKLALLFLAPLFVGLAAGCSDGDSTSGAAIDLAVPPIDLATPHDFFVGRFSCPTSLADYCANANTSGGGSCIYDLSGVEQADAGCVQTGTIHTCGDYIFVEYFDGSGATLIPLFTSVYSVATQQLVAILVGDGDSNTTCLAGPAVFADPALQTCASDAGAARFLCAPRPAFPPCGGLLSRKCA
jgi:hypothetical protein